MDHRSLIIITGDTIRVRKVINNYLYMSTLQKILGTTLAITLLFGVGVLTVQAQSQPSDELTKSSYVNIDQTQLLAQSEQELDPADSGDDSGGGQDSEAERPINFELDSTLSTGSQGEEVRWVQQLLSQHPNIFPEGLVTGYYGRLTAQAVSRLQRQGGFTPVGRVGQQTLDYLQSISNPVNGESNNPSITLTDTFRDTFEFTAELTKLNSSTDSAWRYNVEGSVPSPNYNMEVLTDGPQIIAVISRTRGAAPQVVSDVQESGQFTVDSDESLEELSFDVREANQGGESPTAQLELTQVERPVETGEQFTVDASNSSDPDGSDDDLEYQWSVNYNYDDEARPDVSGSGEFTETSSLSGSIGDPGIANFQVTVRDEDGNTDTAALEFEITDGDQDENTAPEAVDDTFSTDEGETINIEESELLSNDSDPDGDSLSTTGAGGEPQPENGSLNIRADNGVYQYVPDDNFTGTDSFDYRVSDGNGGTDQATVTIEVGEAELEDQAPTAQLSLQKVTHTLSNDYRVQSQNHDALINALNELRGVSVVEPEYDRGEIGLNVTRSTSGLFQTIAEQARGRVQEPEGNINELERVGGNEIETGEQFTVDASNSSDPDGSDDDLEYQWSLEAPSGQSRTGDFQDDTKITTSFDTAGVANFEVTVRDEGGNTDTATLEFEVTGTEGDDPDVVLTDEFRDTFEFTAELTRSRLDSSTDSAWRYNVEGSVPSPNYNMEVLTDGPQIIAVISRTRGAAPQVVSDVQESGRFTVDSSVTPEDISFRVSEAPDTGKQCNSVTVRSGQTRILEYDDTEVEINARNFNTTNYRFTFNGLLKSFAGEGETVGYNGETFELADIRPLAVTTNTTPGGGIIEATIRHQCDDNPEEGEAPSAQLELTQVERPVETGEQFTVDASNSSDPDGSDDDLEYQWSVNPPSGEASAGPFQDQSSITMSFDKAGIANYEVTVRDEDGNTDTASLEFEVTGTEGDDPDVVLTDEFRDTFEFTAELTKLNSSTDSAWRYNVEGSVPNPSYSMDVVTDGSQVIAVISQSQSSGGVQQVVSDVQESGRFTVDSSVTAEDLSFDVRETEQQNRDPEASDDTYTTEVRESVQGDVTSNDSDPDSDRLTASQASSPSSGSVDMLGRGSGRFRYTPDSDFTGTDSFEYKINDQNGGTDRAEVTIEVVEGDNAEIEKGVSFWCGKVNQHVEDGHWVTDSDGISGCPSESSNTDSKLGYCRKFYPETDVVEPAGSETITNWKNRGNLGSFSATKQVYKCIDDNDQPPEDNGSASDVELILQHAVNEIDDFPAEEIQLGDVNQDGEINAADALEAARYAIGNTDLGLHQQSAADVDGDGEVTSGNIEEQSGIQSISELESSLSDDSDRGEVRGDSTSETHNGVIVR